MDLPIPPPQLLLPAPRETDQRKPWKRPALFRKKKPDTTAPAVPSKTTKIVAFMADNIIEFFLIAIGLICLIDPTVQNIKISFTLILIATILLILMTGEPDVRAKRRKKDNPRPVEIQPWEKPSFKERIHTFAGQVRSIPLSNRISLVLISWTLLLFVLIADIEVYFILIFIGVLITRELTDDHTSKTYKNRLDVYIAVFLLVFVSLIVQKIIEYIAY